MAQWGSNDNAANSVLTAPQQYKTEANTTTRDALFGNTTADALITGITVGQFGVDANEMAASGGTLTHTGWVLKTEGSGGRAGRVSYEVLVAGGIQGDASDDAVLPDALITITSQPTDASANATNDEVATLVVGTSVEPSTAPLTFQWTYANGTSLSGGAFSGVTTNTLTIAANTLLTTEEFKVSVSSTGAVTKVSANATVTITT